jgi:hypothetical protein
MMKVVLGVSAAALLAGCVIIAVDKDEADTGKSGPQSCAAGTYDRLIGRNEADIDRGRLPRSFRIVCSDCAVTMDHNPDRLTIRLDEQNRVVSATCG